MAKFFFAFLGSLALHVTVIGLLTQRLSPTVIGNTQRGSTPVYFQSRSIEVVTPEPISKIAPQLAIAPVKSENSVLENATGKMTPIKSGVTRTNASNRVTDDYPSVHFFHVSEVDRPALPAVEWLLPIDVANSSQLRSFIAQLWILDTGELAYVDILTTVPSDLPVAVKENLRLWMSKTLMTPASKGGKFVANERIIEVVIEK